MGTGKQHFAPGIQMLCRLPLDMADRTGYIARIDDIVRFDCSAHIARIAQDKRQHPLPH